ncbi:galactokinase [Salininema proteolyticum]|uniref:Galactokinase n=1 Tax=Salininema proteolyticum TaxID=1607685 RepID=A0ABV8TXH0_9ACTN
MPIPPEQADRAAALFRERFGAEPETVRAAPGRVNLIGEHVDHSGGAVMPFAIGRYCVVAAAKSDRWRLASTADSGSDSWTVYATGVQDALRDFGFETGPAAMAVHGTVPLGAGLSSSAALTCAVLRAMADLYGLEIAPEAQIDIAQRVENAYVGMPCGNMDQAASLLGRSDHVLWFDSASKEYDYIPFRVDLRGLCVLVMDSRAPHRLVDGEYAARRAHCEKAREILGVRQLADARTEDLDRLADPVLHGRARHVVGETERVRKAVNALRDNDFATVGALLNASHASLRDDFEVSSPELDSAVDAAVEAGALGARMVGGGFGGSAIALVERGAVGRVEDRVREAAAKRGLPEPAFTVAGPADGALALRP